MRFNESGIFTVLPKSHTNSKKIERILQFNWKITNHKDHCYVNKLNWKYFRPIVDIDLPELPDFLRPDPSTTGRPLTPIQDIDLPDGFEVVMEGDHELTEQEISKQEETSGNTFKY